jgi:hypothetical protein
MVSGFHIKARTQVVSQLHQPEFECQRDIAPRPPTDQVAERGRNHSPRNLLQLPRLAREFCAESQSTMQGCLESDKETTERLDLPSRRICRDTEDGGVRQLHAQVQHDWHSCVRDRLGAHQKELCRCRILALRNLRDAANLRPHNRSRRECGTNDLCHAFSGITRNLMCAALKPLANSGACSSFPRTLKVRVNPPSAIFRKPAVIDT